MTPLLLTALCAACAALGNIVGGALVTTRFKRSERVLTYFVAFGGGFMVAAALLRMIPESMSLVPDSARRAPALFMLGYFVVHFFEHVLGEHFHLGDEPHHGHGCEHEALTLPTLIGLYIHALFDGVVIASGFGASTVSGLLLFIAVLLHKIPEGSTVASVLLHAGHSPQVALRSSFLLAIATFGGALLMALTAGAVKPYGLPFATGVTIHVAASDLIPEVNELRGVKMALVVVAGAVTFWLSEAALANFGH